MCPRWGFVPVVLLLFLLLRTSNTKTSAKLKGTSGKEFVASDEQRLFRKLMRNYEKSVRPVINASTPVSVRLGITLTQIFDLDEKNQVLTVNVWLDQEWNDEKLSWNPGKFGGIKTLRLPCQHIWIPDIVLYNSVDDYTGGYMKSLAMVSHDGNVFWPPIVRFRSACKVDITYFPFDDQVCHLKLGSWAYDGFQVNVLNRSENIDLSNYVDNGEWELVEVRAQRRVVTYSCCPEPFPDVTFYLHIRRRTTYYTFNVIIPCVILSILTIVGFFLPAESGEKVTLGLTVLLAFSVFMLLIAESMPATSEFVPLIGIYLTVTMAMTSMSVIFSVFVLHLHHRGSLTRRAPPWLRRTTLGLSRVVCVTPSPLLTYGEQKQRDVKSNMRPGYGSFNQGFKMNSLRSVTLKTLDNGEYMIHNDTSHAQERLARKLRQAEEDVLCQLKMIIARYEREDANMKVNREWEDIAVVFDRVLFWFAFTVSTSVTLSLLVFKPLAKSVNIDDYIIQ